MTYRVILEVRFKNNIRESYRNIAVNLKKISKMFTVKYFSILS